MLHLFNRHPQSVGETYLEHMGEAWSFALPMLGAGLACMIHGLFPFAFEQTASRCISSLHGRFANRARAPHQASTTATTGG